MPKVLEALNHALYSVLEIDPNVILLGEDLLDPYGGAFKVTRGLSTAFPSRVITTPISEAGMAGLATGLALRGLRPVVEVMFGDFLTLITDAILNHAAKFRWMYRLPQGLPLVIRTPMGGRRGYGPTHSQSLEKLYLGMPGLRVLAPNSFSDPESLLREAILTTQDPLLFIENKLLYQQKVANPDALGDFELDIFPDDHSCPFSRLRLRNAPQPQLTLVSYGYMAELSRQAMLQLAYEKEVFTELLIPTQIAPFQISPILDSLKQTGRLLTIEEGGLTLGWGAEILARVSESLPSHLISTGRVAAADLPVPAAPALEEVVLPGPTDIFQRAVQIMQGRP